MGILNGQKRVESVNKQWTSDQLTNLKENYDYYINHKKEAEDKFQRKWSCISAKASKIGLNPNHLRTWTCNQINDLKENYKYYKNNKEEAKIHFQKSWEAIHSKVKMLKITIPNTNQNNWTEEQLDILRKNYFYYLEHKKDAERELQRSWNSIASRASIMNITSSKMNRKCPKFLGCHVAERILSKVFKDVRRMPDNNPGYDFICNKGYKIDVKSSTLHKNNIYTFSINRNKITDYFLCIAFDNRENLNPQHVWLIRSNELINNTSLSNLHHIFVSKYNLLEFSKYELTDKLKETIECCNTLKESSKVL